MNFPRILYLSLEPPHEGAACYVHVNEIINGLRRQGHEVILYAPDYAGGGNARPGTLARIMRYVKLQLALVGDMRKGDVIYVRAHFLAVIVGLVAHLKGLTLIQEINGPYDDIFVSYPWTKAFAWFLAPLQRWQFKLSDALITVTPQLKTWLSEQLTARIIDVVPNGANTAMFHPGAQLAPDLNLPGKYVVFFGGLARWQGIETLVAALDQPEWPTDTSLVVVGDGQQRALITEAAQRHPARVIWLGRRPYTQIPGIVASALAGLVPKNNQGGRDKTGLSPLKVFETLASGIPAVVSDFPGQADLVRENKCGLVIPAENPQALAHAVANLAADPTSAKEMGLRGAKTIATQHSWQCRADQTAGIIARTVADRTGV